MPSRLVRADGGPETACVDVNKRQRPLTQTVKKGNGKEKEVKQEPPTRESCSPRHTRKVRFLPSSFSRKIATRLFSQENNSWKNRIKVLTKEPTEYLVGHHHIPRRLRPQNDPGVLKSLVPLLLEELFRSGHPHVFPLRNRFVAQLELAQFALKLYDRGVAGQVCP